MRISLALAVQTKGVGLVVVNEVHFERGDQVRDTVKDAPRRRFSVRSRKKRSTMLSQEALVGVKWRWKRGCLASQRLTLEC